jgi:dihydroorotate dehydrogenase (NAD+) catalytic subunit
VGTANYYDPHASMKIIDALPAALRSLGASKVADIVGSLQIKK